jgi:hypothetical protein
VVLLSVEGAHLFALIIIANGFYTMHMVVGHVAYHTVPLMGVLLWLLFERRKDTLYRLLARVAASALVTAYILYASGFFVVLLLALFICLALPLAPLLCWGGQGQGMRKRGFIPLPQLVVRLFLCGMAAVLISLSKLVAVYSFMRFFPRLTPWDSLYGNILIFIARAFWAIPQGSALFAPAATAGVHEYSMFLSPMTLVGLCALPLLLSPSVREQRWNRTNALRVIYGFLYAFLLFKFFIELTRGYGPLVLPLKLLPIFSSFHVIARFLYVFSLFISTVSIWCLARLTADMPFRSARNIVVGIAYVITLVAFLASYTPLLLSTELTRSINYAAMRNRFNAFDGIPISYYTPSSCSEPVLMGMGKILIEPLSKGRVDTERDGFFNLYHPACFQYPEENNCFPGERIAVSDRSNFEKFVMGEHTTWKISRAQYWSDKVSLFTLISSIILLIRRGRHLLTAASSTNSILRLQ